MKENGKRPHVKVPFSTYKDQKGRIKFRPILILPEEVKGEIDLVGYDGNVLAFVEVKTRRMEREGDILPEENVTFGKQQAMARMARRFLSEWRLKDVPWRIDLLAIENRPDAPPVVRLHKDAMRQSGPRRDR